MTASNSPYSHLTSALSDLRFSKSASSHINRYNDSNEDFIVLDPTTAGRKAYSMVSNKQDVPDKKEVEKYLTEYIDSISKELRKISKIISEAAELGFHEYKAHKALTSSLTDHGFDVETPKDLPTAFIATYTHTPKDSTRRNILGGKNGRTMGYNSEYDGLKGIGQACGHNLIAIAGLGSSLALASALKHFDLPGTVRLIGTPAEEGGGGKIILLKMGAYDGLDACAMTHPGGMGFWGGGSVTVGGPGTLARAEFTAEFFGRGAHAGANPWMGINALDAAVQGYTAVSMMRQQIRPDERVHGIIAGGENWAPNVIPNYARVTYDVRAPDVEKTKALLKRTIACFESAAKATGCTFSVDAPEEAFYYELENNTPLSYFYADSMKSLFPDYKIDTKTGSTASTDFGNVTYACPAFHPGFGIATTPGGGNHTAAFAEAAAKPEAHELALKSTKGLAVVGMRVLMDEAFTKEAKKSFDEWKEGQDVKGFSGYEGVPSQG